MSTRLSQVTRIISLKFCTYVPLVKRDYLMNIPLLKVIFIIVIDIPFDVSPFERFDVELRRIFSQVRDIPFELLRLTPGSKISIAWNKLQTENS